MLASYSHSAAECLLSSRTYLQEGQTGLEDSAYVSFYKGVGALAGAVGFGHVLPAAWPDAYFAAAPVLLGLCAVAATSRRPWPRPRRRTAA